MTDQELLERTAKARGEAHRAPFAEWSKDHTGHSAIVHHTNSWAERGHTFCELMTEIRHRNLQMPRCDCQDGSH